MVDAAAVQTMARTTMPMGMSAVAIGRVAQRTPQAVTGKRSLPWQDRGAAPTMRWVMCAGDAERTMRTTHRTTAMADSVAAGAGPMTPT